MNTNGTNATNTVTLDNGTLRLSLGAEGGEPTALGIRDGDTVTELLWNGDETYWERRAPLLFPIVGRLREGKWACGGREYPLGIHGFARFLMPYATEISDDGCTAVFRFRESAETLKSYPFPFELTRRFTLDGASVRSRVTVKNTGSSPLPFTLGLHPGFLIPAPASRLKLTTNGPVRRMLLSPRYFMSGESAPYELRDGAYIDLDNSLFANDAIILTGIRSASLEGDGAPHRVTVECPKANYIGFWQPVKASPDAPEIPFICIEPWEALPAHDAPDGAPADDMFTRPGTVTLAPGEVYDFDCTVSVD